MGTFDVRVFLLHVFVPSSVQVAPGIVVQPFVGTGAMDTLKLIDTYLIHALGQSPQPPQMAQATSESIQDSGASVVIEFSGIEADGHIEAIQATESDLLLCRDILTLRQQQRGEIAAFLAVRTDTSPPELYVHVRRPYAILRKVRNLPIFDTEDDICARLTDKASKYPLLRTYLSLYADSVAYSDTLVSDIATETRLLKTWALLEAMSHAERGTKLAKVKALFQRHQLSVLPDYSAHTGQNLLDVAYAWRNIIVHCGGCAAATLPAHVQFCSSYRADYERIVEDLSQSCRYLLHAFAHSLP